VLEFVRAKWLWAILFPFSSVWAVLSWTRRRTYHFRSSYRSKLKVICVGNIHSGGSGKTPVVAAISERYAGKPVIILSRGYGGHLSRTGAQVNLQSKNGAQNYGDEPWMLASIQKAPVFIDKNRTRGIKKIESAFPNAFVVLDDGFQHLALNRDINLVCINTDKNPYANFCLPLGDLREPISSINSSDAVVLTPGSQISGETEWLVWLKKHFSKVPVFIAALRVDGLFQGQERFYPAPNERLVSFCGIASPERFIAEVCKLSSDAEHLKSFADHHKYTQNDIDSLILMVRDSANMVFVSTDKDWSKAHPFFAARGKKLYSLRMTYTLPQEFWHWLDGKLG
jgi:tetraacyldisaccharide 4'-kinase